MNKYLTRQNIKVLKTKKDHEEYIKKDIENTIKLLLPKVKKVLDREFIQNIRYGNSKFVIEFRNVASDIKKNILERYFNYGGPILSYQITNRTIYDAIFNDLAKENGILYHVTWRYKNLPFWKRWYGGGVEVEFNLHLIQ